MSITLEVPKRKIYVIFAPDWSPARPWVAVEKEGRAIVDTLCQSADSLLVADTAIEYAQKTGRKVHAEKYLCGQWKRRWAERGVRIHAEGLPRELCNQYEISGWDAAEEADWATSIDALTS